MKFKTIVFLGILFSSAFLPTMYLLYDICTPEKIHLEGTVAGLLIKRDTALIVINTTSGEEMGFECYLTWNIVLLQYSNESQIYHFYLTKPKSDNYYYLRYMEVEQK